MSSGRRRGNTARIVERIGVHLREIAARHGEPLNLEILHLADKDIRACQGCRSCFDRGEETCLHQDDIPAIKAKMDAADGLILASPVYVDDVNGIAKTWIDRLAYVCHRPAFAGKCVYLIATVADSPTGHTLRTMSMAVRTWGYHIVGQTGFTMGALMDKDSVETQYGEDTEGIANALFQAIAERAYLHPSFLSLMIFKIQQRSWQQAAERESYDYTYWDDHDWFDPTCTYFIEHQANPAKVALARWVGSVVGRFVA
jgi:multimeric flavodoxin WrbA